jgi:competence protein ComFA
MSATLDSSQEILIDDNVVNFYLYQRFHKHDIPVPFIVRKGGFFKLVYLIRKVKEYLEQNKPLLIFVPTIALSINLYNLLKFFAKPGYFVNSKVENRDEIINNFRNGIYKYLVTTMVLERGVTIENLQVIIFDADQSVYTKETLIQISGRAGRKRSHPTGDVILLSNKISPAMRSSIEKIEMFNLNKDKIYDL